MQELLDKYRKKELLEITVCTNIHSDRKEQLDSLVEKHKDEKITIAELIRIIIYKYLDNLEAD